MEKGWLQKQLGIIIGVVVCVCVFALLHYDSVLDTEKVDVDKRLYHVGVILDSSIMDRGWNQAHYEGFLAATRELGVQIHYKDYISDDQVEQAGEELIAEGCREIFGTSFGYGEGMKALADKHPDIYFFHGSGVEKKENMSNYFGRMYQARYLSGVVAGLCTKTNHVGYVAAIPIVEVIRGINAFTLGVRSVNPEAVVHVRWSGSWDDSNKEKEVANRLLDEFPIDLITYHQNSDVISFEADKRGVRSVGYHYDNVGEHNGSMVTAAVWNWKKLYIKLIKDCIDGRFHSRQYYLGMDDQVVDIAPVFDGVLNEEQKQVVQSARQRLAEGNWDVFYGPVYDQSGTRRIREGETVSDNVLLYDMNWLVQGTEGNISDGNE